jgi:hypothetical protein
MKETLHWEADANRRMWLQAAHEDGHAFIRINRFPDEPSAASRSTTGYSWTSTTFHPSGPAAR